MRKQLYFCKLCLTFAVFALLSSCGTAKKVQITQLEERVGKLERENASLLKDMQLMQRQVQILIHSLPKPGEQSPRGIEGGAVQVPAGSTTIVFEEVTHDFGTIKEGEPAIHVFKFTNTGQNPLKIESAKASCGCTAPEYPKDPIQPGNQGEIKVTFHTKGRLGAQHKAVTINANTSPVSTRIFIKANVVAP